MKKKIVTLCLVAAMALTAVGGTLAYFTDTDEAKNTFTVGKVKISLDEAKVNEKGIAVESEDRVKTNNYTTSKMVPGRVYDKDPTIHVETGSENSYIFLDMTMNQYKSLFPVMAQDAVANVSGYEQKDFEACLDSDNNNKFSTQKFLAQMAADDATFQAIVDRWFLGIEHEKWELCDVFYNHADGDVDTYGNFLTFRFAYIDDVTQDGTTGASVFDYVVESSDTADIKFMEHFTMPATVTQEMVENTAAGVSAFDTTVPFQLNFKAYAIQADEADGSDADQATELDSLAKAYAALFDGKELEDGNLMHVLSN